MYPPDWFHFLVLYFNNVQSTFIIVPFWSRVFSKTNKRCYYQLLGTFYEVPTLIYIKLKTQTNTFYQLFSKYFSFNHFHGTITGPYVSYWYYRISTLLKINELVFYYFKNIHKWENLYISEYYYIFTISRKSRSYDHINLQNIRLPYNRWNPSFNPLF